ncbi:type VI secretion system baseplate subunit TssK [Methyloglobulus sp.]|uniref:type VI secretion system baseplate subunit TssK n=1 Tax=Methyloglobulus sp. TaxID=2518622 RepID=UPI003989630D
MSSNNKVIWTEGMFLRPSHFQQLDRYFLSWVESRCAVLHCYSWGVTKLEIDQQLLALGKFAITSCQGVFPDGTPFSIPDLNAPPIPLEIPAESKNELLYLSLPVRGSFGKELAWNENTDEFIRYRMKEIEVKDIHSQYGQDSSTVQSGELWTRFRLSRQNQDAYVNIPIAKVIERKADKQALLDSQFIPSCLHAGASSQLRSYIQEVEGILHQRGDALAQRLGSPGTGGVAEITDFLLLQIINRYEPLFTHFSTLQLLHPERLFSAMLEMAGELATITQASHRPKAFPQYIHEDLFSCFNPVVIALREALGWVSESRAIPIPLEEHPRQIRTAIIHDRQLLQSAEFVLGVNAQLSADKIRSQIPRQTTIATREKLRDIVMSQVPGIQLIGLATSPRQIPFHKGMTYFGLDKNHALWQELEKSGTIAMHFSGEYPGLELEFWAIRD